MIEAIEMVGTLTLLLSDKDGRVVQQQRLHNHIVTSGRNLVAELFSGKFAGADPAPVSHMAVGEDATAAGDGDTALAAQRGDRKQISSVDVSTALIAGINRVRVSLQAVFDFNEANDPVNPLVEAGIFTAPTDGVMYNRVVFAPVTKTEAFKLTLLWDVIF
jgi:hypothetical protein